MSKSPDRNEQDAVTLLSPLAGDPTGPSRVDVVRALAAMRTPEQLLQSMEAVGEARDRINLNVAPLLALEAMTITVMSGNAAN